MTRNVSETMKDKLYQKSWSHYLVFLASHDPFREVVVHKVDNQTKVTFVSDHYKCGLGIGKVALGSELLKS